MPTPLARGIIITVSVIVAAGIAAYESPQVRQWVERSREKIAIALHSLGDDIHPNSPRESRDDPSMREDQSEKAEERRRQKREEILEKGRRMEEHLRRKKSGSGSSENEKKRTPSFDNLVDEQGNLRVRTSSLQPTAETTAMEAEDMTSSLRPRHVQQPNPQSQPALHESVDAPMLLRQFQGPHAQASEPWESQYERELRTSWNIPLPAHSAIASSHASESLIDLTPTTEGIPDPDFSIPSASEADHPLDRAEYFSFPGSRRSHTLSEAGESDFYYAHPNQPLTPLEPRPMEENTTAREIGSSAASIAGSTTHIHVSDLESEDDFSEFGDGIRTPASVWTDVDSTVSGDN